MLGLVNMTQRLNQELRMEELKERIQASRKKEDAEEEMILGSRVKTRGL